MFVWFIVSLPVAIAMSFMLGILLQINI